MEYAIILVKTKTEDTALEIAGRQICQLKDKAFQYNIIIIDCIFKKIQAPRRARGQGPQLHRRAQRKNRGLNR